MFKRMPSLMSGSQFDGLLCDRFPAHKEVEGGLTVENGFETVLQFQSGCQAVVRTTFAAFDTITLAGDPIAQVAVGQIFQQLAALPVRRSQLVIVDQGVEAIARPAIPDVPDERAMMEEFAVLLEEVVAQPMLQAVSIRLRVGNQLVFQARRPILTEGHRQQLP